MRLVFGLFFCLSLFSIYGQELNCVVNVNASQIDGSERVMFEEMQKAIFQLVNGRKWTTDEYEAGEKIECSIIINLTEKVSTDQYKGNIQVQASRPVYNTTFKTPIMNIRDEDFVIKYNQFEPLQYNESTTNSEFVSIIGFYLYMILGYNYDSFSLEGGTRYLQKAQQIVNFSQSSSELGWKAFEDKDNRYWLVENALSARFKPLRKAYYQYHRMGFDLLQQSSDRGRKTITQSLKGLKAIHNVAPSSYNLQVFFNAKKQEVFNLYSEGIPQEKQEIAELLITIDPGNSNTYEKLRK
jgi:hypothetical protein